MVLAVALNPAIDKTAYASSITEGEVKRLKSSHSYPGGKGVNVAYALGLSQNEDVRSIILNGATASVSCATTMPSATIDRQVMEKVRDLIVIRE